MQRTLRSYVDSLKPPPNTQKTSDQLKTGDQVVLRKPTRRTGPTTSEILVGEIVALADNGKATVSMPRPGGGILRTELPVKSLIPVSTFYKKASVPVNPGFRKVF